MRPKKSRKKNSKFSNIDASSKNVTYPFLICLQIPQINNKTLTFDKRTKKTKKKKNNVNEGSDEKWTPYKSEEKW